MKSKTWRIGFLVFFVLLLCLAGVLIWQARSEQAKTYQLTGEAQALRDRADAIEAKAPAGNAPLNDKLAYYDQLAQAKRISGDHTGSVAAFEERVKLSDKDLDYMDYLHVALSYQTLDKRAESLRALDQVEKLLPPDDFDSGFFRVDIEEDIIRMRKELQT